MLHRSIHRPSHFRGKKTTKQTKRRMKISHKTKKEKRETHESTEHGAQKIWFPSSCERSEPLRLDQAQKHRLYCIRVSIGDGCGAVMYCCNRQKWAKHNTTTTHWDALFRNCLSSDRSISLIHVVTSRSPHQTTMTKHI